MCPVWFYGEIFNASGCTFAITASVRIKAALVGGHGLGIMAACAGQCLVNYFVHAPVQHFALALGCPGLNLCAHKLPAHRDPALSAPRQ